MPEAPLAAIHTQATPGGVAVLLTRNQDEAARVDWEMLFNEAMANTNALCAPFEKQRNTILTNSERHDNIHERRTTDLYASF